MEKGTHHRGIEIHREPLRGSANALDAFFGSVPGVVSVRTASGGRNREGDCFFRLNEMFFRRAFETLLQIIVRSLRHSLLVSFACLGLLLFAVSANAHPKAPVPDRINRAAQA